MLLSALLCSAFIACGLAQSTVSSTTTSSHSSASAGTSVTLFLPPEATGDGFIASVVSADPCTTKYGLVCTSGSFGGTVAFCEPSLTAYVTYLGTSSFTLSHEVPNFGVLQTFIEACSIHGTTKAVCARSYGLPGHHNKPDWMYSTTTLTGDEVVFATVPITAGANKLVGIKSTSSCPAPSTSTSAGAAAASTGGLYRAQLLAGAAGLLVGAVV